MSWSEKLVQLGLAELLRTQDGLRLAPTDEPDCILLVGQVRFAAHPDGREEINDEYQIEIRFPGDFPESLPEVTETGGRIPRRYHTNPDGSLCLGSPASLRLAIEADPTAPGFVRECIVPFLYGWSYYEKHKRTPFGELPHGAEGLRQDFAEILSEHIPTLRVLRLAALRKRIANKRDCYCGSGRRLGVCHNRIVNKIRKGRSRKWLRREWDAASEQEEAEGKPVTPTHILEQAHPKPELRRFTQSEVRVYTPAIGPTGKLRKAYRRRASGITRQIQSPSSSSSSSSNSRTGFSLPARCFTSGSRSSRALEAC